MNVQNLRRIIIALSLLAMAACEKPPAKEEEQTKVKRDENLVVLSKESLANIDLVVQEAVISPLEQALKVPGRIAVDANRTAKVTALFDGRVSRILRDVGDPVVAGAELGALETPELLDKPYLLRSPIAGTVVERAAAVGEIASKGQNLFTVSDLGSVWLVGEVGEKDAAQVRAGQNVSFRVLSYPGEVFKGRIARVGSMVETSTRTFEIRVEVPNRAGRLKPGMFADIEIITRVLEKTVVVDDASLQSEGDLKIAFVNIGEGRFEKRVVETGRECGGRVQVFSGIKPGEKVVTEGSFSLKSELLKGELGED